MRANHWRLALACAAVCTALATIYGRWLAFEPFGGPSLTSALALTASIVMAGYSLLPVVVRMYGLVLPDESRPTRVDFSQPAVQAYIVVPLLFIGFSVAATMWAEATHGALATSDSYREVFNAGWRLSPISLSFVFFSLWLMSLCSVRRIDAKSGLAAIVASVACSIALYAVLCGITLWFNYRHDTSPLLSFVVGPPIVLATASMTIVLLIGMLGRQSTADGRRWWSRLMAWLLAYAMAWLVVTGAAAYVPAWTVSAWRYDWRVPSLVVGLGVAVVIGGLVAGHADQLGKAIPVRRRLVILSLLPLLSA